MLSLRDWPTVNEIYKETHFHKSRLKLGMFEVKLVKIDRTNLSKVLGLKVFDEEVDFVAPNSISIAEAYVEDGLQPRAVKVDSDVVGFIMYGRWEGEGSFWITRLMIDKKFRGKGYAKEAVMVAVESLFAMEGCSKVSISFEPENETARKLYSSLGFLDTGSLIEGEVLFELER